MTIHMVMYFVRVVTRLLIYPRLWVYHQQFFSRHLVPRFSENVAHIKQPKQFKIFRSLAAFFLT